MSELKRLGEQNLHINSSSSSRHAIAAVAVSKPEERPEPAQQPARQPSTRFEPQTISVKQVATPWATSAILTTIAVCAVGMLCIFQSVQLNGEKLAYEAAVRENFNTNAQHNLIEQEYSQKVTAKSIGAEATKNKMVRPNEKATIDLN